jgi:hypothetical protein
LVYRIAVCFENDTQTSGFGGLEVSMLASGSRVREFKPGRNRRIFLM